MRLFLNGWRLHSPLTGDRALPLLPLKAPCDSIFEGTVERAKGG